ncbi:hypothetical protein AT15_06530 [Kosmotoga arenicorallina S304]|uniref:ABC transporter domain-containing protein n=1 Tax=Kosmotoga arenicorallina S304 TaxID=1453497 RepID=A0A176JSX1_9BACT|nr:ABC transporter ATP-binding protein [Kosmotoga arenicorallina]OAA26333.1 hypothetical protein AT15_06530 [Kosmotoga arenicorallina S304]
MNEYMLEMRNICKTFEDNNVIALDNASLLVRQGTVHALVGENGAGKTTMMKILCGIEKRDKGHIFLKGKRFEARSAKEAFNAGIGIVQQHFRLIEDFTVAENVVLGQERHAKFGFVNMKKINEEILKLSIESGLEIDPESIAANLSAGQRQKVEILRTLYCGADLIILDEPTTVLTEQEIEELFKTIRTLKMQGKTVIFITHKLEEIFEISDDITILRHGKSIASGPITEFNKKKISYLMVGEDIDFEKPAFKTQKGEVVFRVENLHVKGTNDFTNEVKGVSFEIAKGEILGIAGITGNGQLQLIEALAGLKKVSSGRIMLGDKEITNHEVREIRDAGLAYIPEDRMKQGASCESSIFDNVIATKYYKSEFSKKGWIDRKKSYAFVNKLMKKYTIKAPSPTTKVGLLSGGNIQKVIIAREFSSDPEVLIVCEPTWGLDVRSTKFVYDSLHEMRTEGKAILLVSSNLDEILHLADRILVMYKGEIIASFENSEGLTKSLIGEYMLGLHLKEKSEVF